MSTNKTISQNMTAFTEYGRLWKPYSPSFSSTPPNGKNKKKFWVFFFYCNIYPVTAALWAISSYRLFFRTAQTSGNYSFGTMMSYNLIL